MTRDTVIDLTVDDDDNENDQAPPPFVFRSKATILSPASNAAAYSRPNVNSQPRPTQLAATSSQAQPRSASHSFSPLQSVKPPLLNGNSNGRPTKRRKFDSPTSYGAHGEGSAEESQAENGAAVDRQALMKCLQRQVIPHLDAALKGLPHGAYNTGALGTSIIGRVADKEFEQHFRRGNGQLTDEVEAHVADKIQLLVRNLIKDPKYRASSSSSSTPSHTETPSRLNGAVLPSIENEEHRLQGIQDAAPQAGPADVFEEEPMELDPGNDNELEDEYDEFEPQPPETPTPPPLLPKKKPPITPQQLRTRAKAPQWQSGRAFESRREGTPSTSAARNSWFGLSSRPYLRASDRQLLMDGANSRTGGKLIRLGADELRQPSTIHVDFTEEEVKYLRYMARELYGRDAVRPRDYVRDLRHLIKKDRDRTIRNGITEAVQKRLEGWAGPPAALLTRSHVDVTNYLDDLFFRKIHIQPKSLRVERDDGDGQDEVSRANVVPSVLLAREISGNRPFSLRRYQNFNTTLKTNREDALEPRIEWTGCAGDITTISWLSNTHFICGTTTHSDSHNQQYNKPGNLLLGSVTSKTLRAYPDHRIVRPIVAQGDNALESMVESQDPWLFTSVVSSDYEPTNDLAFTSSFDKTVKVWKLHGDAMEVVGTWGHEGRVNFVVASKHPFGMIATAADVPTNAVRVYQVNKSDISSSSFDSYSCTRVHDEDYVPSEKWAYFPAAIRWGLAPTVRHLLLIGYSPRSLVNADHEIPEDKLNSGELCLWDTIKKTQVKVNSAATQNVFEVVWHPARESFAAATSASGLELEGNVNTQIRIFEMNDSGAYTAIKTLDCSAVDINEISIRPNCTLYSYVTASCTDGNVYVWDSARDDDLPICILKHGNPVEELLGEREQEDVGAKFTEWGTTADRLYTGSSDGVVKVWNVRHGRRSAVLVKDLIEASGPIICGAFSPDFTKLAVGDGTGRVYVMTLDEDDNTEDRPRYHHPHQQGGEYMATTVSSGFLQSSAFLRLQIGGKQQAIRRPRPFIPHPEVPPPGGGGGGGGGEVAVSGTQTQLQLGQRRAAEFLRNGELVIHPDETIGVVQGPNYANTGLFRAEAHLDDDASKPLLSRFEFVQQENTPLPPRTKLLKQSQRVLSSGSGGDGDGNSTQSGNREGEDEKGEGEVEDLHARNTELDARSHLLYPDTRAALRAERAETSPAQVDYDFSYEDEDVD